MTGWISAVIGRRTPTAWAILAIVGALATATVLLIGVQAAFASHPEVSLPGSNFEIDTDANLRVDDPAPSIDWANVTEIRKADTLSGPNDESFGQGTKEDTAAPIVVDGSIPPNKSDLKFFGLFQEGGTSGGFLNLFWSRVQDPQGTTNMDFELNKRQCTPGLTPADTDCTANGITPKRSVGDVLVVYDLSQGGTHPTLSIRRWTGSAWGPATDLTAAADATGSINTSPIPASESDGIGAQSARTFGEAQIKLSALLGSGTTCTSFGSAYLKSRSSDSFTAALKDFVPPTAVNISNCGSLKINKTDDSNNNLDGAVFKVFKDVAPLNNAGGPGAEDTTQVGTCTTTAGTCSVSNLLAGDYWVVETSAPTGYDLASPPYQHITITVDQQATVSFVDPAQKGAIQVTKTAKHAGSGSPNLEATFTVKQGNTPVGTITTDSTTGKGCLGNLPLGSYSVTETSAQAGYKLDPDTETANVAKGSCSSGFVNVDFENVPLTDLTVSVNSQVTGGTASKITCTDQTPTPADGTPGAFDDTSETIEDLEPGTYTCTVVVDP
jgi:hypothetical protein